MKTKILGLLAAGLLAAPMAPALAVSTTYGFTNITNNNAGDAAIGEAQLFVEVIDLGGSQVAFRFFNTGPASSSITDVYFDDGTLLGIASITNTAGLVKFSEGANPGSLPGGNNIAWATTGKHFTADSDSPAQPNGVNPGEELTIVFNLINGQDYDDTIAALALAATDMSKDIFGALRIGIHVQGFASGGSESFVCCGGPPTKVPEPGTLGLLGLGLIGLGMSRRRKLV